MLKTWEASHEQKHIWLDNLVNTCPTLRQGRRKTTVIIQRTCVTAEAVTVKYCAEDWASCDGTQIKS